MSNKSLAGDYCNSHLAFYTAGTFEEAIQKLREVATKNVAVDFDEVVVFVSLGRNCTSPTRCQPCIFRKRRARKREISDSNNP